MGWGGIGGAEWGAQRGHGGLDGGSGQRIVAALLAGLVHGQDAGVHQDLVDLGFHERVLGLVLVPGELHVGVPQVLAQQAVAQGLDPVEDGRQALLQGGIVRGGSGGAVHLGGEGLVADAEGVADDPGQPLVELIGQ